MTNMAVIIFMYHIRLVCAANILYPPYIQTRKAIRNFICSHTQTLTGFLKEIRESLS
jgi:hypothetical protein